MHGNQLDPVQRVRRSPLSRSTRRWGTTSCGRSSPSSRPATRPGSLLEGVQWLRRRPDRPSSDRACCTARWSDGCGGWPCRSRPRWCCASCRSRRGSSRCCTITPSGGWSSFGILMVAIAVIAAVVGIATMLRVNRALADASISDRGDAASHNAARPGRGRAPDRRGVRRPDHRPHPRARDLTGGRRVLRQHRMRHRGGPDPEGPVRAARAVPARAAAVDGRADRRGRCCRSPCPWKNGPSASPPSSSAWFSRPNGPGPRRMEVVGHLPDGATWPIDERSLLPWVRRRRVRRVAALTLLTAGVLNVVFALLWPIHWTRPVNHWLPFGIHPVGGVTAVIGGLALAGVARGVRLGYRRAWVAALRHPAGQHRQPAGARRGAGGLDHRLPVRPVAAARAPPLPGQPVRPPPGAGLG